MPALHALPRSAARRAHSCITAIATATMIANLNDIYFGSGASESWLTKQNMYERAPIFVSLLQFCLDTKRRRYQCIHSSSSATNVEAANAIVFAVHRLSRTREFDNSRLPHSTEPHSG